jgi:TrkA domain protein
MTTIDETRLPGVGVRHEFTTHRGERVGVLKHLAGDRELLVYDRDDPDSCERTLRLDEADAEALAELLGISQLAQSLGAVREAVGGLVIEWVDIAAGTPFADRTIADTELRTRTGVSIIALLRSSGAIPAPTPDQQFEAGDTVIVVGTLEGVRAAEALFEGR